MPGNKCRFYNECRVKSTIYGWLAFNKLILKIMELVKSNLRGLYCKIVNTAIYFLSTFHSVRLFQELGLRKNEVDHVLCCWVGYRLGDLKLVRKRSVTSAFLCQFCFRCRDLINGHCNVICFKIHLLIR